MQGGDAGGPAARRRLSRDAEQRLAERVVGHVEVAQQDPGPLAGAERLDGRFLDREALGEEARRIAPRAVASSSSACRKRRANRSPNRSCTRATRLTVTRSVPMPAITARAVRRRRRRAAGAGTRSPTRRRRRRRPRGGGACAGTPVEAPSPRPVRAAVASALALELQHDQRGAPVARLAQPSDEAFRRPASRGARDRPRRARASPGVGRGGCRGWRSRRRRARRRRTPRPAARTARARAAPRARAARRAGYARATPRSSPSAFPGPPPGPPRVRAILSMMGAKRSSLSLPQTWR